MINTASDGRAGAIHGVQNSCSWESAQHRTASSLNMAQALAVQNQIPGWLPGACLIASRGPGQRSQGCGIVHKGCNYHPSCVLGSRAGKQGWGQEYFLRARPQSHLQVPSPLKADVLLPRANSGGGASTLTLKHRTQQCRRECREGCSPLLGHEREGHLPVEPENLTSASCPSPSSPGSSQKEVTLYLPLPTLLLSAPL